jgi:hypothetical protein
MSKLRRHKYALLAWCSLLFAVHASWFTSCMLEETIIKDETDLASVPVSIQAGFGTETRVSNPAGDQWEATDTIGLYMIRHGSTLADSVIREKAKNKPYKVSGGAGTKTATFITASDTIYYPNGEDVNFIVYYPYSDKATVVSADFKYRMDVSDQSLPSRLDLLYSNNKTAYNSKEHAAVLPFEHLMTRLIFDAIRAPGSNVSMAGLQMEVQNVNTSTDFDLSTGTPASSAAGQGRITPLKHGGATNDSVRMEATLIPMADASGVQLLFVLNNKVYSAKLPPTSGGAGLKKGSRYTYRVVFDEAEVSLDGQLSAWGEEPGGDMSPVPGDPDPSAPSVQIAGYPNGRATLYFVSGGTEVISLNESGKAGLSAQSSEVIHSITLDNAINKTPILIGRKVANALPLSLKVDANGKPLLRDPVNDYIPIGSYAEFQLIKESANLGKKYKQETHLDLLSVNWTPIGNSALPFTGEYDGSESEITNLKIEGTAYQVGLFRYTNNATLRNIRLVSGAVNGASAVGGICGVAYGSTSITNVHSGITVTGTSGVVGGICGTSQGTTTFTSCRNTGNVKTVGNNGNVGGLIGNIGGTSCKIKDCDNRGEIEASYFLGGLVGYVASTSTEIIACRNSGFIKNTGSGNSGGLVGGCESNKKTTITACYNTGTVHHGGTSNSIGGIVGSFGTTCTLTASYNTGTVTGSNPSLLGLICGYNGGTTTSCYWTKGSSNASKGVVSGTDNTKAFGASSWPTTGTNGWGTGDGSGANKYWKSLGGWNNGTPNYPTLWWE